MIDLGRDTKDDLDEWVAVTEDDLPPTARVAHFAQGAIPVALSPATLPLHLRTVVHSSTHMNHPVLDLNQQDSLLDTANVTESQAAVASALTRLADAAPTLAVGGKKDVQTWKNLLGFPLLMLLIGLSVVRILFEGMALATLEPTTRPLVIRSSYRTVELPLTARLILNDLYDEDNETDDEYRAVVLRPQEAMRAAEDVHRDSRPSAVAAIMPLALSLTADLITYVIPPPARVGTPTAPTIPSVVATAAPAFEQYPVAPATAGASLSLPPPKTTDTQPASSFGRLRSAIAITKLLQARLGKYGTSLERRAHEVEMARLLQAAEARALRTKALVLADAPAAHAPAARGGGTGAPGYATPGATVNATDNSTGSRRGAAAKRLLSGAVIGATSLKMLPPPSWRALLPWKTAQPRHHPPPSRGRAPPALERAPFLPLPGLGMTSVRFGNSTTAARFGYYGTAHNESADRRSCGGLKCLPVPRRRSVRCLPAPHSVRRRMLPPGWQPAGLLSWQGAATSRALVVRNACLDSVVGPTKASAMALVRANASGRDTTSSRHRPVLLPLGSIARMVKQQADVAIAAAAVAAAARSAAEWSTRSQQTAELSREAVALRAQLARSRESIRRKEAHIAQLETVLGATAGREQAALEQLRMVRDVESTTKNKLSVHLAKLQVAFDESDARALHASVSLHAERKARLDAEAAAREARHLRIAELKAEIAKARRTAEARKQQASRLAMLHEKASRSEARALEKNAKMRLKMARLEQELKAARVAAARAGHKNRPPKHAPHTPHAKAKHGRRGAEFWRGELEKAKTRRGNKTRRERTGKD